MPEDTSARGSPADRGYALCACGRSGSTLLCQYLSSSGVLGHPLEYFNAAGRRMLDHPDYPDDPKAQVDCVLTMGATANGIYGLKLFPDQFDRIAKSFDWTRMLPNLAFVVLRRRDLLAQAISMVRAVQTGQWRSAMPMQGSAVYDGSRIYQCLRAVARDFARWDVFFARKAIEPTRLWYEDLVLNPQGAVDAVASLFGLRGQASARIEETDLKVQRDALTEIWRERFRQDFGGATGLDIV
jgi:trehalose 2-sulfotransferase